MKNKSEIFEDMVLMGISCGLLTPQEWYINYQMRLMNFFPYNEIPNVLNIMENQILPELYLSCNFEPHNSVEQLRDWVNKNASSN